ncbi:MAG: PorV/PorQ family protein [Candidatus Cloacimonetes bacterium]|nr:PorV/PorQ family protein [Candidatus Cloacimonadota bacterium]
MRNIIIIIVALALIPVICSGEIFPKTGTAGLQFLKIGVDARAQGMAEAYTAVTNDISSIYWNPAGLALSEKKQVMFSHTNWVADIYHEFFAFSYNHDLGTFALSATYLTTGYMEVTDEETFGPTGEEFYNYDLAVGLSYANSYTDKFAFGFTAKYLREVLDEYDVNGFSVDIGSVYNTGWENLTIGMALRNFGPNLKYEVDNDGDGMIDEDPFDLLDNDGDGVIDEDREELEFKIPMSFSLGAAADILREKDYSLIGSFQIDSCVDREETYNLGFEFNYLNFSFRTGYQFNLTQTFSAGLGWRIPIRYAVANIDYAYNHMGDLEEDSIMSKAHRISLKLAF